jgi:Fur family transcriptional regulator, ferric uptake regulator
MCQQCDYSSWLESSGLVTTKNRLLVLEVIGTNNAPLSAQDIYETLRRNQPINRVTVYRILDLLVEHGILERLSGGGRTFFYGLAPNDHHRPHPHFYCRSCGNMHCLSPESLHVDTEPLERTFPGHIDNVAIRVDGICRNCLRSSKRSESRSN